MRISPMGYYDKSESGGFKKFLTVFFSIMVAVLVIGGIAYFVLNGFKNEEAGIKLEKAETLISLNGQAYTEPNYACRASIPLSGFVTGQKMVDANGIKIKVMQKTDSTYVRVRVFYESKSQEFDSSSATAVALNSGFVFSVNEGWVFDTYTSALDKYFYLGDDDKVVATTDGSEYVLNLEDILFPNLTAYNLDASLLATENLFLTVEAQAVQSESVQINSLNSLITVIDNNKLYPKPVANGYFLQFNTMGGKETSNYVIKAGDPFTMPSVPNVKRWYQDEKYSTAYFVAGEVNTRINANTTFYARYSITNSIFVIFEKDVASFGTLPQNGEASISGENYLINCNLKLVKRGFKHIGWKIKGTYNALEMEQGKLKIPTTIKRNSAVTLVPVWEEEVYAVIFTTDDLTLTYGDNNNTHIGANKTDTTTAIDTVVYESSNTAVATINSTNGRLTIVGSGEAIISVKVNGSRTDSYNLIVNKRVVNVVWSSITTFTYNGTAHCPTAMANSGVSGEEIVLAISGGETNAGSYTASASIQSVNGGSIDNYDLANNTQNFEIEKATNTFAISTEVTKYVQESLDLTSLITNAGQGEVGYHIASNGTITGSSINEGNLTIGTLPANNDNNGVLAIVAQASGNSNYNPSAEFTIQVTVQKYNAMLNWASTTPSSLIITTTSSFATAEITCDNGTAGNVVYSSSNTSVISVDATTGALTPVNFGEATITATMASSSTVKGLIITQNISVVLGKLSTVTNVQWSSTNKGEATWTAVDAVAGITTTYSVQLYKGGVESGLIENIEGTTYNFASTIQSIGGGEYTFKVCAKSSNPTYCGNGEQSVESNVLYAVNVIVEKGTGVETATIDKNVLFAGKTATLTLQAKTGYILGECTSSDSTRLSISGTTATLSETNANAQSITITATATPISYTIVYNGNGETAGTMGSSEHTYDVDKNLTTSVFTRTGFTFAGWNTKANGSGTAYVNGATVKNLTSENGATVTLYAVWELVQYAIGYTLNNGTLATPNPSYYTIEDNTFSLNNPTRIGYTFAGWTGSNGATPQINVQIEQGSTGEKSFTANWTPITYTIVYNGNENTSGTMANSEHTYDVDQNLTTNGFTKTGYTFAGWNTKANGSGTAYENEATVKNLTSENGATVTLYAIWSTGSYTVSLNVQGGKGGTSSVTATYGSAMPSATAPTKEGYTFAGYYDATSGGTQYYTSGMTSAKNWDKASNTTLYAHWTANTYTITFDNQGVTGGTSSVTATYGSAMPSATAPTKEGYTFAGYYDATSGGTQYYTSGMTSAKNWDKASNTTLYAYWTATTYTITYNLNDGSASNPTSYTIETPTFTLNNPTRTGFAFTGWSGTGLTGSTNTSVTISQGSTGNKTYTANWTAKTYTITFDKQSGTSGTSSVTATYGSAMPSATAPTRTGYTFGGYYTSTNGGGTQYYNASMVSVRNWDKTSATTLYAKWTINQYTATFDGNGGSSGGTITKDYNTALGTLPTSSRAGSAFNGWWTSTSGGTQITSSTLLTQNVIYYAHWTPAVAQIGTAYYATLGIAIDAVPNNGTATIEIIGDTSESGLIIGDKKKITLVANGANRTITRNANSVLFTIRSGATLTLGLSATDANVINIIGSNQANSVIVNHGTLNLNSANIYGGVDTETSADTGPYYGGGVNVYGSSAQFTMSGGTIANNTAKYGGGVYVSNSATFAMSGGEISGNTAGSGGGVGAWDGTFTMDGGTISGNTATSYGGGVYMYGESVEFTMNDGTISDNTAGSGGGVYMHGKSVTTGGVITYNRGTFNMNGGIISGNTTTGDGGGVEVIIVDFTMDGGTISGNELTGSNGYGGGVYVYLGTFTMSDGEISDNTAGDGGGVYVAGSIFTMDGGEISDNTAGDGGGVSANSAQGVDGVSYSRISEFNMTGGTISGNTATSYGGGGVEVGNGTFTMSGGTISGNTATSDGGGVFVFYSATFNMTGGTISNNTAESGGGVYVSNGGTFEMYNGTISGNSTTSTGGGVYVFNSGTFTMSGGTIYGSTAGANANTATIGASLYKSGSGGIAQYGNYATITTPNNDTIIGHA